MANLKDLIVTGVARFASKVYASEFVGTLTGNASSATKLETTRNINGILFNGKANAINYGTCSTAAGTAAKTVSCANFTLVTGAEITVKFTVSNTAASPTLNVNSTGAKPIYYRGAAISSGYLAANRTYNFRYNGTQYELVGDINTYPADATENEIINIMIQADAFPVVTDTNGNIMTDETGAILLI